MTGSTLRRFRVTRAAWTRAFWALMFVAHAPAVIAGWRSVVAGDLGAVRFTILIASQILFLLKILDAPYLRLPVASRGKLAIVSMVVLLHGDVIQQAATHDLDDPRAWAVMTVGVVVSVGAALLLRVRRLDGIRPRQTRGRSRRLLAHILDHIHEMFLPPRFLMLAQARLVNRAPPN